MNSELNSLRVNSITPLCCEHNTNNKGDEKERIFSEADIFVFPTYYDNECFPLVLLEAMAHGLPCVTTTEGGIRDIVVHGSGFTVSRAVELRAVELRAVGLRAKSCRAVELLDSVRV